MRSLFVIFLIISSFHITICKMNFPKIIWVYWETDINTAPLITRVSYQKMQLAAKQANWTVILINGSSIKNYLKQYVRFQQVVDNGYRNSVQQKSDILRISLIEENGGVWIDFSCIPFQDFSWLNDQSAFDHLIINKIGTNKDDPDILLMGQGYHQSPLFEYDQNGRLIVQQYFGNAIHFIAAKKKVPLMTAFKQKMYKLCLQSYRQMVPYFLSQRLFFHYIDRPDAYYSGNMALQSVLQQKQMQLDNQLNLFGKQKRITAYQHYKLWQFHGQVGPTANMRHHMSKQMHLFFETKEQLQQRTGKLWFFFKLPKWLRDNVQMFQNNTKTYLEKNKLAIQDIIKRNITDQECKLYWIVKGSILHILYNNSKYQGDVKSLYISKQQRQILKDRCFQRNRQLYRFQKDINSWDEFQKAQNQNYHYPQNTLKQKIIVFYVRNRVTIFQSLMIFQFTMLTFIIYVVIRTVCNYILSLINNKQASNYQSNKVNNKQFGQNIFSQFIIMIMRAVQITFSRTFYCTIQNYGKFPQYNQAFYNIIIVFLIQFILNKYIQNKKYKISNYTSNQETFLQYTSLIVYLPLAYVVFVHLNISYPIAYYNTITVFIGGTFTYWLIKELQNREIGDFKGLFLVKKLLQNIKWLVFLVFFVFWIEKNSRYVKHGDFYLKEHLAYFVLQSSFILFVYTNLIMIIHLFKILMSSGNSNANTMTKNNTNNPKVSSQGNETAKVLHFLFTMIMVFMVIWRNNLTFNKALQEPSAFNYYHRFEAFLATFVMVGCGIRMNLSNINKKNQSMLSMIKYYVMVWGWPLAYVLFGQIIISESQKLRALLIIYACIVIILVERLRQKQIKQRQQIPYEMIETSMYF